jgi:hypothetical protein
MDVPAEILILLSNTLSPDESLRKTSEERLTFFEKNEQRMSSPPRHALTRLEFPLLLTTIAVDETRDSIIRAVPKPPLNQLTEVIIDDSERICITFMVVIQ